MIQRKIGRNSIILYLKILFKHNKKVPEIIPTLVFKLNFILNRTLISVF